MPVIVAIIITSEMKTAAFFVPIILWIIIMLGKDNAGPAGFLHFGHPVPRICRVLI